MIKKKFIFNFKFLGVSFFILMLLLLMLVFFFLRNSQQSYNDLVQQSLHKELAKNLIMESQDLMHGKIDKKSLGDTFHYQMLLGPAFDIYVVSTSGKILAWSSKDAPINRDSVNLESISNYVKGSTFPLYGTNPRSPSGDQIFSAAELKNKTGAVIGYLYVIIGGEKQSFLQNAFFQKILFNDASIILMSAILAVLSLMALLYFSVLNPIYLISRQLKNMDMKYISNNIGNIFSSKFSINEIKVLIDSTNGLLTTIKEQMNAIRNRDDDRRKFLSYLAHDIKTPLSSMQGYVETWLILHRDAPDAEYLEIALKNSRSINKFTEQIIELSNIETNIEVVKNEKININQLAKNLFDKFNIKVLSKKINFSIEIPNEDLYIYADLHKFERILSNLIDNAIRHTKPTGFLKLKISRDCNSNSILFEVIDSGEGIDPSHLPFIFQSKYSINKKVDTNFDQKQHGLGLAIVKSLLEIYKIKIFVKSVVGKGSTFYFEFPLV